MIENREVIKLPIRKTSLKFEKTNSRVDINTILSFFAVEPENIIEIQSNQKRNTDYVHFSNKEIVRTILDSSFSQENRIGNTHFFVKPIYECNLPKTETGLVLNQIFIPQIPYFYSPENLKHIFENYGEIYSLQYMHSMAVIHLDSVVAAKNAIETENQTKRFIFKKDLTYFQVTNKETQIVFDPNKIYIKSPRKFNGDYSIIKEFSKFGKIIEPSSSFNSNFAILTFTDFRDAYRAIREYEGEFEVRGCLVQSNINEGKNDKQYRGIDNDELAKLFLQPRTNNL